MAIAFRQVTAPAAVNATSLTINTPAGTVDGDVMVAFLAMPTGGATTITPPAGWTSIRTDATGASGTDSKQEVFYKVAASEGATHTFNLSGTQVVTGAILSYSGVDNASPIAASAGTTEVNSDTSTDCPSVTPANSTDWLVVGYSISGPGGGWTQPSGMTERSDVSRLGTADLALASGSATGTKTATAVTAQTNHVGQSVILRLATPSVDKSLTDTGSGSDALSVEKQRLIALTDTGAGTDALSVDKTVGKDLTDTASGSDALSVEKTKYVSLTDTASGSDALTVEGTYNYTTPQETEAHMSASLRQATPSTPDPQSLYVRVDGSGGAVVKGLIGVAHNIEPGKGTEVVHAELILTLAEDMPAGSYTFTAKAIDESWDASTVTYNTAPSTRATTATEAASGLDAGDEVTIDITAILAGSVSVEGTTGEQWFGIELTVDGSEEVTFYGAYSPLYRPRIKKEVSRPPAPPFNLRPTSGLHVSELKPYFAWDFRDLDGEDTLSQVQFQLDTTDDFETPSYDSGEVAHTGSYFDSASPPSGSAAFANLTNTNSYYWRAKHADNHGLWSEFSDPQLFTVTAKGTLTVDPTPQVPTPTVSWSLSVTQRAYYVAFERYVGGAWVTHWEQPWTTGTADEVTLPDSYVLNEQDSYRRIVRVTDTTDRASLPGSPSYYEDIEEFTVAAIVMA